MKVQLTDCDTRDLVRGVKVDLEAKGDHWERRLLLLRRGLKVDTLTLRGWCYETRGGVVRKVRGRAEGGALGITGRVSRGQSDRQWQSRKTNTMNSDKVTGCSCLKCLFLSHLCPEILTNNLLMVAVLMILAEDTLWREKVASTVDDCILIVGKECEIGKG